MDYRIYVKSSTAKAGSVGWAAIIQSATGETWEIADEVPEGAQQTPMRSTLLAVINALSMLPQPGVVTIYTDVQYIADGFTGCTARWIRRGWKKRGGKPVAHRDLWEEIIAESRRHQITIEWVSLGVEGERAQELVTLSRDEGQRIFIRWKSDAPSSARPAGFSAQP